MAEELELVLVQLADPDRPVRSIALSRLSDLPRTEALAFDQAWANLDAARRLETITSMVERAEANIHLNFHVILRQCLCDPDSRIRRIAADGLWEDEKPSLIDRLAVLLAEDPAPDVRAAAASSLGRFVLLGVLGEITEAAAREAEAVLRAAWERPHEPNEVRRRVLESLAYVADPTVSDLIEIAYQDEDDLMRQSAIFAMGRSADPRWGKPILAELLSRDPAMRFEAAVSAGELGLVAAIQRLIRLLDDADGSISEAAVVALGKIGGREAKRALESVIRGEDERLAQAAEEALEELIFNSTGLEETQTDGPDADPWRQFVDDAEDAEEDGVYEEDEYADTRMSESELLEDEELWDAEANESLFWLDEDQEELQ